MNIKKKWNKFPTWLKGGMIALIIELILIFLGSTCFFLAILLNKIGIILNASDFITPVCMPILSIPLIFTNLTRLEINLLQFLQSIMIIFIIGAIIGAIISWKKQSFNLKSVWLKGGLIGLIVGFIISAIGMFLIGHFEGINALANVFKINQLGDFLNYLDLFSLVLFFRNLLIELSGILACFIPGAITGLFIQKIKESKEKSLLYFAFLGGLFGLFLYFILSSIISLLSDKLVTWRYALILFAPKFIDKIFNLTLYPFCTLTAEIGESRSYCIFFLGHVTNIIIYALIFVIIGVLVKKFKK